MGSYESKNASPTSTRFNPDNINENHPQTAKELPAKITNDGTLSRPNINDLTLDYDAKSLQAAWVELA